MFSKMATLHFSALTYKTKINMKTYTKKLTLFGVICSIILLNGCFLSRKKDQFPEPSYSNTVFLMPMILDITVDPVIDISRKKLQDDISRSLDIIKTTLKQELERRGYYLIVTQERESDLSLSNDSDIVVKNALNDFRSLAPHIYDKIQHTLPQAINEMISNDPTGKSFHPNTIHNVLFLQVESHIAKDKAFGESESEAVLKVRVELVDIRQSEIINYKQRSLRGESILSTSELKELLTSLLASIPVNTLSPNAFQKINLPPAKKEKAESTEEKSDEKVPAEK
jgi:hypothetical protein